MKNKHVLVAIALLVALINVKESSAQAPCNCFLVKEDGAKVKMEKLTIKDNGVEIINDPSLISVAFTLSEGLNGDMSSSATRGGMLIAQCKNGVLKLKKRSASGAEKAFPDMPTQDLKNYDIRVNITGGNGTKIVYKISNYETFSEDKGPKLDMFGGKLPVKAGDYIITTETKKAAATIKKKGQVSFKKEDGWMIVSVTLSDGNTYQFVVDMAATGSVIDESILPKGSSVTKLEAISYDGNNTSREAASMGGATGAITDASFLGRAALSSLQMGDMTIPELSVNVLKKLPQFLLDRNLKGILGLDVLRMYGSVTFNNINADKGTMVMGEADLEKAEKYNIKTAGKLYFLEGNIQGKPVDYLIDMGSRYSFISKEFAKTAKLKLTKKGTRAVKGISNQETKVETGVVSKLTIGNKSFANIPVTIGKIDALHSIGLSNAALLGMDFFSRFNTVAIDFEKNVLSVVK